MNFDPKSRQQKLVEKIYPYFGDLAIQANEDEFALRICRHLLLMDNPLGSQYMAPFIDIWHSEHPEENSLTNDDLMPVLHMLNDHITNQLHSIELQLAQGNDPRARLKVINGGLSKNPDIPYVDVEMEGREINF